MPARFDGERGIYPFLVQPLGFVYHVFIAALEPAVHAAVFFDKFRKPVAGHRICHDHARLFRKEYGGNERDEAISVDLFPLGIDGARAVDVGIEDDAEVRFYLFHLFGDRAHRVLVFGVGYMVGEPAVRLQELAAFRIRAEGFQYLVHIKAARAVARIHDDPFAGKGLFAARLFPNEFYKVSGIRVDVIYLFHAPVLVG